MRRPHHSLCHKESASLSQSLLDAFASAGQGECPMRGQSQDAFDAFLVGGIVIAVLAWGVALAVRLLVLP